MNKYVNFQKQISIGNPSWEEACVEGLLNIAVDHADQARLIDTKGREFINMCSCSYLGLDTHTDIVRRAADAILMAGTLNLPTSRVRIRLSMLDECESALSDYFRCEAILTMSCGAASAGVLPVLASGHLSGGQRPVMVFDKHCHFSMNHVKAVCGDETEVHTCEHNDVSFIEDMCKHHGVVAYVADGAYSMGGHAPVEALLALQEKYGLLLYFDDSHSLSAFGDYGQGYVRSHIPELNDRTIIVASLAKGFGACGGAIFLGKNKYRAILDRFGGPMSWSQYANPACMGAVLGSIEVHRSPELKRRQDRLKDNIALFDSVIPTVDAGAMLPVRVVPVGQPETAVEVSRKMFEHGFYTSAVFFPVVARGTAGLRVMPRADIPAEDIQRFATTVKALVVEKVAMA
ncbi:7-keto-8-aminopelargonate synthetase [Ralstonia pseudosolanacearum]|uniref:aminotransferase class I/II-fold pyridoxal phosphate-dependent enzyme n=1 Tax=Ralstonia pseudosolanacearum TaxID=1310165 RepID=UPI000DAE24CB|nr:aminotransferase class I/II-fold pyridoxal phosphate-dependent enzyme [Ralstonia pseudosolanacearum]RAA04559.1 7-keto-8-aminopelargonate synthetase [Ralstonia pseudosolanacearum]